MRTHLREHFFVISSRIERGEDSSFQPETLTFDVRVETDPRQVCCYFFIVSNSNTNLILTITGIILDYKLLILASLCRPTGQFKDFCKTTKMRKEDQQ